MRKTELYYQVAYSHLQDQDNRNSGLEGKATVLTSVAVLLMSIGAILLKDFSDAPDRGLPMASIALITMGVMAFLWTMFATFNALRPRDWRRDPELPELAEHVSNPEKSDGFLEGWVCKGISNSIDHNEKFVLEKSDWVTCAIYGVTALVLAVVGLALSLRF